MKPLGKFSPFGSNIRILAFQTLISQIGLGMLYVVWQPHLLDAGISITQLGTIQMVLNISTGLGLLTWGHLSDRYGRKPILVTSNLCRVIALTALIVSRDFLAFVVFACFMGFTAMWMRTNPARSALIAESVEDARRATVLSILTMVGQATNTVMASGGGYIAIKLGYTPIFYVSLITDIVGLFLITLYIKETHQPFLRKTSTSFLHKVKDFIIPEAENKPLYMIMILQGAGYVTAYSLFYGALTDFLGFTPLQLGFMSTGFHLTWSLSSIPLGKIGDKIGRKKSMLASYTMAYVSVMGFIIFRSPLAFILFNSISAFDAGLWMPSWTSYLVETIRKEKRSTVMGKIDAYARIGAIPAPWLAGYLLENYGFTAPFYVHILTMSVSLLVVLTLKEK